MSIIVIFISSVASFSYAQNNKDSKDEDKEFDFIAFDKLLVDKKFDEAEAICNDWIAKRQKMIDNGSEFGFLDVVIKHKYALIKFNKKEYNDAIAIEDEVIDYLKANINDENDKNLEWTDRIYKAMSCKSDSYYMMNDFKSKLIVDQDIISFFKIKITRKS